MKDAGRPGDERSGVSARVYAITAGFCAYQPDRLVFDEGMENPDSVTATADTGYDAIRQATELLDMLFPCFAADNGLKVPYYQGIWVLSNRGTEKIVSGFNISNPIAYRLIYRILERSCAAGDWPHLRTEQFHPEHIQRLTMYIFLAHIDYALESEQSTNGSGGNTVLSCASLGNDPALAHSSGQ